MKPSSPTWMYPSASLNISSLSQHSASSIQGCRLPCWSSTALEQCSSFYIPLAKRFHTSFPLCHSYCPPHLFLQQTTVGLALLLRTDSFGHSGVNTREIRTDLCTDLFMYKAFVFRVCLRPRLPRVHPTMSVYNQHAPLYFQLFWGVLFTIFWGGYQVIFSTQNLSIFRLDLFNLACCEWKPGKFRCTCIVFIRLMEWLLRTQGHIQVRKQCTLSIAHFALLMPLVGNTAKWITTRWTSRSVQNLLKSSSRLTISRCKNTISEAAAAGSYHTRTRQRPMTWQIFSIHGNVLQWVPIWCSAAA